MKVTSIKKQVKNPERVSIFIDGKYSFSFSLDELLTQKLKVGTELEQAEVKKLKKISSDGKLKARTLAWLLNRPHSTREFQDYLRLKKAEPELIGQLTNHFQSKNYLSDEAFGRWLTELRQRAGKSNRAIKAELYKKGLDRELIDELLENSIIDESTRLKEVINKKAGLPRYQKNPEKLAQYLLRQGFNYHQVKEALKIKSIED